MRLGNVNRSLSKSTGSGGGGALTGQGQQQETDYSVSPTLTTDLFDLADLTIRATYAQVFFDEPIVGPPLTPLDDVALKGISGKIGTGKRASLYEATVSANYLETDDDFRQRAIIGSLFLNLTEQFTAIGRIGYERITDPSIAQIRGPVWSVGGRYRLGRNSVVQVEYGRRFGDESWLGELDVAVTPRLTISGSFRDTLIPVQLTYLQGIEELFNEDGELEIPSPNSPGNPDPTVLDDIVRDKDAQFVARYLIDLRSFEFSLRHSERRFLTTQDTDKLFSLRLALEEQLSRKLSYVLGFDFFNTYAPAIGNAATEDYGIDLAIRYQVSTDTQFTGGYLWRLQTEEIDDDTYENVLRVGVEHQF